MPFTPAHSAIVLPLLKSRLFSATGLIVGSLSPDFEYFLKMQVSGVHGHTIPGLLYFDLPVTVVLSLLFHQVVKKNLIANMPLFFQRRFQDVLELDFIKYLKDRWFVFVISALMGAASHIFWDGFTHNNTYFVRTLPFYEGTFIPFDGVRYPLFYALQHISTVVGLAAVGVYVIAKRKSDSTPVRDPKFSYWIILFLMTLLILWIRFYIHPEDLDLGNFIVSVISGLLLASVCCGFINFKNSIQEKA